MADFGNVDSPTLYNLECEVSRLREIACNEKQRLEMQIQNADSRSALYSVLLQNLDKTKTVYQTCKEARIAVRKEIGARLYTPEYIASLRDNRAELMEQLTSEGQLNAEQQGLLDAINVALTNPRHIRAIDPQLDQAAVAWLRTHGAKPAQFTHFVGDPVGRYMFRKNLATMTHAKDLENAHPAMAIPRECANAVVNFGSAALDMIQAGFAKDARILTDTARAVYDVANFSVNVAHGALEGTAEGCRALAHMCAHPIETIQTVSAAVSKIDEFWMHLCQLDPKAFSDVAATRDAIVQAYKDFRQLPLNEKGHFIGKAAGMIWGPGKFVKGAKCLAALPKVQEGLAAIGRMTCAEMDILSQFAKQSAAGAMLAGKVNGANLVTLGGKVMTKELADALIFAHGKIGGTLPMQDFVGFIERTQTPITQSFKRAFREFEKIASAHIDPKAKSLLKVPCLIEEGRFKQVVKLLKENEIIKKIGGDLYVHGSRAKGTAKIYSDIDIGIRVSPAKFDQLIKECFANVKNSKVDTMLRAIETGKIHRRQLKLSALGKQIEKILGIQVDLSVIKNAGLFDVGPFIDL